MRNMILQNVSLSSNIKRLRADSGLSQIKVVEQMNLLGSNLDRPSYAKIELGRRNIKVTDLVALKQVYNVDFSEFFKGIQPHE